MSDPGRQAVPEEVSGAAACGMYSGLGERPSYNMADDTWTAQSNARRNDPQENASRCALAPVHLQIQCQRLSHLREQGELFQHPALAPNAQLRGAPTDVTELEGNNLSGTQTESCEEKQNCSISPANRRVQITGVYDTFHFFRLHVPR